MAAAAEVPAAPSGGAGEPRHGLRIFLIWLPLALIADVIIIFVWGPHLPPGGMSTSARSQQVDFTVLGAIAAPVMLFVLTYFGYALIVWRHREGDDTDGPPTHGNTRIAFTWIATTTVIVIALAIYGTIFLWLPAGAGAGEGNTPIWRPSGGAPLQVQVIGQQWRWTYRYPQFGGFETTSLVLPVGENIQFNVTSLDVIHSFWAYQLAVKADANPGINNVAYTKALHTGFVQVRCAELCGLWHADMTTSGVVVSVAAFRAWARVTEIQLAALTKNLPPYALTYDANQIPQLGTSFTAPPPKGAGLTGAGGGYYGGQYPVQP
jgi:cytochrome c oxidase subunit 2